ncbi:RNA-guided pseudouridylation complex pseudouridine synthase subunit Cbf5 [Halorientalis sp.]|jgi:tRNA pseudouridine55 synthase|uniref:RNA-guided pseudouridylation complex pseudouridine synthase subunit Cbf5 n=1 Tax=Halorientalis sp. TaxID=1931229 RepID=UPI002613023C|nr:RNA-guided pseudouridylation complex pseudouridine synthase subunit Cbf5 [Halorientalis sp.]
MVDRGAPDDRSIPDLLQFGVVNLDKPPGPSAHQVAAWVRDMVAETVPGGIDGVAHAGTLDPKVTGSLPLLLGDATRMAQVFDDAIKEYVAVLELHGRAPADLESVVAEFEGHIYQKPPRKSAVKRQLRIREIHDLDVLEVADRRALLRVRCASGTYIRKLCHDVGLALGTGAHMGHLRRTATGQFDSRDLVTLEDLADALAWWEEDGDSTPLQAVVDPAERALGPLSSVTIAPSAAEQVAEGASVYAPGVIESEPGADDVADRPLVACYTPDEAAVCLGRLAGDPEGESGTVVELDRVLV